MTLLVTVIIDPSVRDLCFRPYAGHPRGCKNYGRKVGCPPQVKLYNEVYDTSSPIYAIVNEFDLAFHVSKMRERHPHWSERQLSNLLYWQKGARRVLKQKIVAALHSLPEYHAETCPEGMGVNVTETMRKVGVILEWPPIHIARQIALLGKHIK